MIEPDREFARAVANSHNILGVARLLGLRYRSSSLYGTIRRRIAQLGLSTTHFQNPIPPKHKAPREPDEILILDESKPFRQKGSALTKALLAFGVPYECSECRLGGLWNERNLVLDVDHRNGDWHDNRLANLRFLCPNCHSQQPSSGRKASKLCDCGRPFVARQSVSKCTSCRARCAAKRAPRPNIGKWPSNADLANMVSMTPLTKIAAFVGVTEAAVRKRCRKLGISTKPQGFWSSETSRPVASTL